MGRKCGSGLVADPMPLRAGERIQLGPNEPRWREIFERRIPRWRGDLKSLAAPHQGFRRASLAIRAPTSLIAATVCVASALWCISLASSSFAFASGAHYLRPHETSRPRFHQSIAELPGSSSRLRSLVTRRAAIKLSDVVPGTPVVGVVMDICRDGISVEIGYEVPAFVFNEALGAAKSEFHLGQEVRGRVVRLRDKEFKTNEFDDGVSRLLEMSLLTDTLPLSFFQDGDTVQGTVRAIMKWGAFIDVGADKDAMLRKIDMADNSLLSKWRAGTEVQLQVLTRTMNDGRVRLTTRKAIFGSAQGLKPEMLKLGDVYKGVVSRIVHFGVFIDIGITGLQGLASFKDINRGNFGNIDDLLKPGDEVEVTVTRLPGPAKNQLAFAIAGKSLPGLADMQDFDPDRDQPVTATVRRRAGRAGYVLGMPHNDGEVYGFLPATKIPRGKICDVGTELQVWIIFIDWDEKQVIFSAEDL